MVGENSSSPQEGNISNQCGGNIDYIFGNEELNYCEEIPPL